MISNVFTMGYYTPIPGKIALSTGGLLLTGILVARRDRLSLIVAILFFIVAVLPLIPLWIFDRKLYGM